MYVFTQLDYIGCQLQQAKLGEDEEGETLHLSRWTVEISTTKNGETGRQRYVETFKYVKRVVYKVLQYDVFARKCFKLLVSGVTVWSDSLGDLSICQLFAQFWSSSELYQHDLILSSPLPMHCNAILYILSCGTRLETLSFRLEQSRTFTMSFKYFIHCQLCRQQIILKQPMFSTIFQLFLQLSYFASTPMNDYPKYNPSCIVKRLKF